MLANSVSNPSNQDTKRTGSAATTGSIFGVCQSTLHKMSRDAQCINSCTCIKLIIFQNAPPHISLWYWPLIDNHDSYMTFVGIYSKVNV